jgi:hypothetical protein
MMTGKFVLAILLFLIPLFAQENEISNSEFDSVASRDEICSLQQSLREQSQWLSFTRHVESTCGIKTDEGKQLALACNEIANELAVKKRNYKSLAGRFFNEKSCELTEDIFLYDVDITDSAAIISSICYNLKNLSEHKKSLKNIQSQYNALGRSLKTSERYQWTRDRIFLEQSLEVLKKAYKTRTGRGFNKADCGNDDN